MSDHLSLGLASTAVGLVNGTISLLKEAREAAKRSEDHDLKDRLSEVFDSVLQLKEVLGNLHDENADLRKRLEMRAALKWNSESQLYYAENDSDPFCPSCFDLKGQHIRLHIEYYMGTASLYRCKVCKNSFRLKP